MSLEALKDNIRPSQMAGGLGNRPSPFQEAVIKRTPARDRRDAKPTLNGRGNLAAEVAEAGKKI